jgi:SAM-dependent methyltransferase
MTDGATSADVCENRTGTVGPDGARSGYLLDNAGEEAATRFAALSQLFDPGTIRHIEERGINRGWRCLEVGAGSGSIAAWLADRVAPAGCVLATDINPRFLESIKRPNLDVRRHDIATDPLPEAAFDLVHSRLVLLHVPERERALAGMISALKPGGWLVEEEYDSASMPADPAVSPSEVLLKTQLAMMRLLEDRGVNRRFGRLLFGRLRAYGLVNVGAEARIFMWASGSPGTAIVRANYEQLRETLIDGGYITPQQFAEDLARLDDPDFVTPSGILWSAWGQRP